MQALFSQNYGIKTISLYRVELLWFLCHRIVFFKFESRNTCPGNKQHQTKSWEGYLLENIYCCNSDSMYGINWPLQNGQGFNRKQQMVQHFTGMALTFEITIVDRSIQQLLSHLVLAFNACKADQTCSQSPALCFTNMFNICLHWRKMSNRKENIILVF